MKQGAQIPEADYYEMAAQASMQIAGHYGLEQLQKIAANSKKIVDIGCGEGTRLNTLVPGRPAIGIDLSGKAINKAKKKYPKKTFICASAEKLPFPKNSFDLVYTAFVLEHTIDTETVISEMIRICKVNGDLVFLCPNFGAPSRRSPNSIQNPITKLIKGFVNDFLIKNYHNLQWTKVDPKPIYYKSDDDTTIEPYLYSLIRFLNSKKVNVLEYSSLWTLEPKSNNPRKIIISTLGKLNIFPFKNWGPQIYIHARKTI